MKFFCSNPSKNVLSSKQGDWCGVTKELEIVLIVIDVKISLPAVVEVATEEVGTVGCGFGYSRSQHSLSGNSLAVTQPNMASSPRRNPAPHIPSTAVEPAHIAAK